MICSTSSLKTTTNLYLILHNYLQDKLKRMKCIGKTIFVGITGYEGGVVCKPSKNAINKYGILQGRGIFTEEDLAQRYDVKIGPLVVVSALEDNPVAATAVTHPFKYTFYEVRGKNTPK